MLKNSKKAILIGLLICTISTPTMVFASSLEVKPILQTSISSIKEKQEADYIAFKGKIEEVITNDTKKSILVKNETTEGWDIAIFHLTDDVLLLDQKSQDLVKYDSLQEGSTVTAYYRSDTIMTMIYPPTITPSVIMLNNSEKASNVEISKFDNSLTNSEGMLKLNIADKTTIVYKDGVQAKKEDLYNKNLVVFYSYMTKSLPAQTAPDKIIILDKATSGIPKTDSTLSFLRLFMNIFRR